MAAIMKTKLIGTLAVVLALGATSALAATAEENWAHYCTKCHGADGKAQTKPGAKFKIKDFTNPATLGDITDGDLVMTIDDGVTEHNKEKMKPFKEKLSPKEIGDLLQYIRDMETVTVK